MLAFLTQNPHVLQVDMALVRASNHCIPVHSSNMKHDAVNDIYTVSTDLMKPLPRIMVWLRVRSDISAPDSADFPLWLRGICA